MRGSDRDRVSQLTGSTGFSPFTKLGALAESSPIGFSDTNGASVLFVGSDKALRTFRFANGSWGTEQFIRGGFAPVRGGG